MSATTEKTEYNISEAKISEHIGDLAMLIEQLDSDQNLRIEYGAPSQIPGGSMAFFHISRIQTAGGIQYRLCQIHHGTEGSGDYTASRSELLEKAEREIHRVHRKNPNPSVQRFMEAKMNIFEELDWKVFNVNDPMAPPLVGLVNYRFEPKWMADSVTVSLDMDSAPKKLPTSKTHPRIIRLLSKWVRNQDENDGVSAAMMIQRDIDRYKRHKHSGGVDWENNMANFATVIRVAFKHRHR